MDEKTLIEEAIQMSVDRFADEHPAAYAAIADRLGDPLDIIIQGLKRDNTYNNLVAQTDKEVDIANIIKVLIPAILNIAKMAIGLL